MGSSLLPYAQKHDAMPSRYFMANSILIDLARPRALFSTTSFCFARYRRSRTDVSPAVSIPWNQSPRHLPRTDAAACAGCAGVLLERRRALACLFGPTRHVWRTRCKFTTQLNIRRYLYTLCIFGLAGALMEEPNSCLPSPRPARFLARLRCARRTVSHPLPTNARMQSLSYITRCVLNLCGSAARAAHPSWDNLNNAATE